jgi:hypothetical protein
MKANRLRHCRVARLPAAMASAWTIGVAVIVAGVARAQEPGPEPGQEPGQQPAQQPASSARPEEPKPAAEPAGATPFVRGQLASRYWLRWTGSQNDSDLYESLLLDVGDATRHAVTGHFYGRMAVDLDGDTNGSAPFFSLQDVLEDSVDAQVYDAFIDLHRVEQLELLRIGRQTIAETPEMAFFDGIHGRTSMHATAGLQFGAYAGVSTHLYESSHSGDMTAGLYGECRPWQGGRLRLDWMHLEDEALLGPHADDLISGGIWHTFGSAQLEAQYSRIESRDRDVHARAAWSDPDSRFTSQLTWYQLLTTQRNQVVELDPFFNSLNELFPYWQLGAMVGKGLTDTIDVDAGADLRRVSDSDDIGTFNRDYERLFLTVNIRDVLADGVTLTITADYWDSDDQDVQTWAGDLSKRCNDQLTASAGTYYSLYKFSLFANAERDHVRTYYGRLRYAASRATDLDFTYEFEQTDLDDFQVLRMGFTWHF